MAPAKRKPKVKAKAAPVSTVKLPKVVVPIPYIPASGSEGSEGSLDGSDPENPRENDVEEFRIVSVGNKTTQPLVSSSAKENARPAPPKRKPISKKSRKAVVMNISKIMYKRALRYHTLKRDVLAAFIARLLVRSETHMELLMKETNDDDEDTINMDIDDSVAQSRRNDTSIFRTTVASSENTSMFHTTEVSSDDDDSESRNSYTNDWRSRGPDSESHADSEDE